MSNATRRDRRAPRRRPVRRWPDAAFLAVMATLGAVTAWPLHAHPWFLVVAAASTAAGMGAAAAGARRGRPAWVTPVLVAAAYLVLGVALAVPSVYADPARLPWAVGQVVAAPVTGWKNLLTLDLPVGTYQAVLAPSLLVFLLVPALTLTVAWRTPRLWTLAPALSLLLPAYGIVFGSSAVRGTAELGPLRIVGVVELLVGIGVVATALAWYMQHASSARSRAVRLTQEASGVRVTRARRTALRRALLAAGMALVAAVIGAAVAPLAVAGTPRDVARTAIDPDLRLRTELSPLTTYRAFFADDRHDAVQFRVTAAGAPARVRLATLPHYDGVVARVTDPSGLEPAQQSAFTRVPAAVAAGREARVEIEGYSGVWVPVVDGVAAVEFRGERRSALADGFFANAATGTAIALAEPGLTPGTVYVQAVGEPVLTDRSPADLTPGGTSPRLPDDVVPDAVQDWIDAQEVGSGGPALAELVSRLRARGFLSHALTLDGEGTPDWVAALDGYRFEPSRAGHSADRIGDLFRALLDRQNEVGGDDDAALVAAAGDDEQFAVAAALIADRLGFASRVVLGARLTSDDPDLPTCDDGACRGGDMAVWTEVQDAGGDWIALDVTPQHTQPIAPDLEQRSDPQNPTQVDVEGVELVPPPEAAPSEGGDADQEPNAAGPDLTALWAGLRIAGIALAGLLVLISPIVTILVAKLLRRRARRSSPDPTDRMVGGWDELVDTAVDGGLPRPAAQTRTELAALYDPEGRGQTRRLAVWADEAVFAHRPPADADGAAFWELVDAERERMRGELGRWERLRAGLSLRSLRRGRAAPSVPASDATGRRR